MAVKEQKEDRRELKKRIELVAWQEGKADDTIKTVLMPGQRKLSDIKKAIADKLECTVSEIENVSFLWKKDQNKDRWEWRDLIDNDGKDCLHLRDGNEVQFSLK